MTIDVLAAVLFALAIFHTFGVKRFQNWANQFPSGSLAENLFHLLGEVEVVFGLWAALYVLALTFFTSGADAIAFVESLNFTEPLFVFVIMVMAATRPIVRFADRIIVLVSRLLPLSRSQAFFVSALIIGPLLGSLITEPAAMTVTALMLRDRFFGRSVSDKFKYLTLAVLFVNVSVGGVLTSFAAPPVLMVAGLWGWDSSYMLSHFGWKAVIIVLTNAALLSFMLRKELSSLNAVEPTGTRSEVPPAWLIVIHLLFMAFTVKLAHHPILFVGGFLFFLGVAAVTKEHQEDLKLKEGLLVAFFLAGLVVLGAPQAWWLQPLLTGMSPATLFAGGTGLTAVVDNAALTYLGAQVKDISEAMKYALVAGAVSGGGLTVIANAPNPAGFSILSATFGTEGISPLRLLLAAIGPTIVAMLCFWFF